MRILLTILVLAGAAVFLAVNWPSDTSWEDVFSLTHVWVLQIFALLSLLAMLLRALRWHLLMHKRTSETLWNNISSYGWFFALGSFTPLRSGELGRLVWIKWRGGSVSLAAGSMLIEKASDAVVLLVLLSIGIYSLGSTRLLGGDIPTPAFIVCVIAVLLAALLFRRIILRVSRNATMLLGLPESLSNRIDEVVSTLFQATSPKRTAGLLALNATIWTLLVLGFHISLATSFPGLHWSAAFTCIAAINLSSIIAGSPGNIGIYEAVFATALAAYGIAPGPAIVVALALHLVSLLVTATFGAACLWVLPKRGRELRSL